MKIHPHFDYMLMLLHRIFLKSIIGFYKGPFEREAYLHIRVIGGSAVDLGGVRRQMLSVFFHEVAKGAFDQTQGHLSSLLLMNS